MTLMPCFKFKFNKIPISHLEAETPFGLVFSTLSVWSRQNHKSLVGSVPTLFYKYNSGVIKYLIICCVSCVQQEVNLPYFPI